MLIHWSMTTVLLGMVCLSNYSCSGRGMLSCRLHDCSCDRCLPLYYYIYIHACVYMCVYANNKCADVICVPVYA